MTIVIGAETPFSRFMLAVTLQYRPSILSFLILALCLAITGLAIEVLLPTGGIVALVLATVAAGITWGLLGLEARRLLL